MKKSAKKTTLWDMKQKLNKYTLVKNQDRYILLSMDMVEVDESRDMPMFRLVDLQENMLIVKTALEIVKDPEMSFYMRKEDLAHIAYWAGREHITTTH